MLKRFIIILISVVVVACAGKGSSVLSIEKKYDEKGAVTKLEEYISKQFNEKGYTYYKTIPNSKRGLIVFSWKNSELNKYYIRYFLVFGDKKYVELVDKGSKYEVSVKNASTIANCYGYTHKLPNVYDKQFKINFDQFSTNDCRSAIRFSFNDKNEAMEVASALSTFFSVVEEDDEQNTEMEQKADAKSTEKGVNRCSVDKVLKMKEIGLTNDEIKKICE